MQRFDKGYIYYGLLSDFFRSLFILIILLGDFFEEGIQAEKITAAIPVVVGVFFAIYLCLTLYRIAYYRTSGYEFSETEIKCNRGVFFRKRSVLDCGKIHAVNKKQNLFHRIFHIAILTVDSGSANTSHQAEVTIIEREDVVDRLLSEVNRLKKGGTAYAQNDSGNVETVLSEKDCLYSFTSKNKMLYTLTSVASTAFFTAVLGVLLIIVLGLAKLMIKQNFLGTWGQYFMFAALITAGAILLFALISFIACIIYSFVAYYMFTISKSESEIQISFGILEKHTNTFSYDRIKAVKVSQSLLQRIFGFATIKLEVIGYMGDEKNGEGGLGVLVPFCKYDEVTEILQKTLPDYIPDEKQSQSAALFPYVSWFFLIFGIAVAAVLMLTVVVMLILKVSADVICAVVLSVLGVAIFVLGLKIISAVLAYKINGIAVNGEKVTAYSGAFARTVTVFKSKNLTSVESVTTPLRKKSGIASLVMHLKTNDESNEIKVHIQEDTLVERLEKILIV